MPSSILVGTKGGLFSDDSRTVSEFEGREVRLLIRGGSDWWTVIDRREIWHRGESTPWTMVHDIGDARTATILPTAME